MAVQIGSSLGTISAGSGRLVVRTSGGTLYAIVNNAGTIQIYKSANGSSWANQDGSHSPASKSTNSVALAIDSGNTLHAFYVQTGSTNNIYHVTYNTSTDLFGTPEQAVSGTSSNGVAALDCAIDSNDIPHVVVARATAASNQWTYANKVGGSWNTAVSTTVTNGVTSVSILIDNNNLPEIALLEFITAISASIGNVNNATSFTRKSLATAFTNGPVSIGLDSSNNTWVSFLGSFNLPTIIEHNAGDPWATWQSALSDSGVGAGTSIVLNGTTVYIIYEQNANHHIVYDKYTGSWLGETLLDSGTYHNARAKWSFYNNNQGSSQIDYLFDDGTGIYWDDLSLILPENISVIDTTTTSESITAAFVIPIDESAVKNWTPGIKIWG